MRSCNPWKAAMRDLRTTTARAIVVRHGSTDRNRGGVGMDQVRGHADIPMTQAGENEVAVTAAFLGDHYRIDEIHTSDLQRAVRTAEIIAEEQSVGFDAPAPRIVPTAALRSWDMGAGMEGKVTTDDVVAQIKGWVANDTVVPPGGESFRAFCARVCAYVTPLMEAAERTRGSQLAFVAHGRTCQVIDLWIAAGCDEECMHRDYAEVLATEPDTVPPGGGIRYKYDGLGWQGFVLISGVPSDGMKAARGDRVGKSEGTLVS